MTSLQFLRALSLMLLCLTACQSKGSSQSSGDSQAVNSKVDDGPSQDEIQAELIAGIPKYISQYCDDKANMLSSVRSIRYAVRKRVLLNTLNGGHKVIRIEGTLYWSYESKALKTNPSAGNLENILMTNDPGSTNDHEEKWEFLGFGPWSDILGNFNSCRHFM